MVAPRSAGPSPATACGAHHFEMSVLHPAKEPACRGTVFGFYPLAVSDDDLPDASQLGDGIGVVVHAEIVVHARLECRCHEERRRLLAALVAAGRLPRLERKQESLREVPPRVVTGAEGGGPRTSPIPYTAAA